MNHRKVKTPEERAILETQIKMRYESLRGTLTERRRRIFDASIAYQLLGNF